ncbi:uncharacterized protein LOC125655094 [Ostrea edulis]|uniref:uncharacterized protein LOC125655094 n=1 Tax=Ostrea edulis TaxID=37623 RepID=UPI0024AEE94F|nr:uncharacterized protein LOC125655094 [Ostrea edulis]
MGCKLSYYLHKLQRQRWELHHREKNRNSCPGIWTNGRQIQDSKNQLNDNIIAIGSTARAYLIDNKEDVPPSTLQRFFMSVRKFYECVAAKMLAKFPFGDPVVCGLSLLNPNNRGDLPPAAITDIARRFPNLLSEKDMYELEEEFLDYQTTPASDFCKSEGVCTDEFWGTILQMKNKITLKPRFPMMQKLVSAVLTIPNSNADCERVFSVLKKIHTEMRSNLENSTVCALLSTKLNQTVKCHNFKPTKDHIKSAKQACLSYSNSFCSK